MTQSMIKTTTIIENVCLVIKLVLHAPTLQTIVSNVHRDIF